MRGDQTTDTDDLDTGDATDTDDSDTGDDQDEQSDSSDTGDDSADADDDDSTDEDTIDADGYTPAQRAELDQLTAQGKQKDDHISNLGRELADLRQRSNRSGRRRCRQGRFRSGRRQRVRRDRHEGYS